MPFVRSGLTKLRVGPSIRQFFKRLLSRFGIHLQYEGRKEYKSVGSTFTETSLPPKQKENLAEVLIDLNCIMTDEIESSRLVNLKTNRVADLTKEGPFLAAEAER